MRASNLMKMRATNVVLPTTFGYSAVLTHEMISKSIEVFEDSAMAGRTEIAVRQSGNESGEIHAFL